MTVSKDLPPSTDVVIYPGVMSVCYLGYQGGKDELCAVDQADWNVPKITDSAKKMLCDSVVCNNNCDKCIITRIMEEV